MNGKLSDVLNGAGRAVFLAITLDEQPGGETAPWRAGWVPSGQGWQCAWVWPNFGFA